MMKSLICKAKRKDNMEWVEGFYFCMVHDDKRHEHHFIIPLGADLSKGTPIEQIQVEIDIETICDDTDWIPCSERLPEKDFEKVLVWFEYFRYGDYNRLFQTYGISYTYKGEWSGFVNGSSGWHQLRVLAWMPLPEPYNLTRGEPDAKKE